MNNEFDRSGLSQLIDNELGVRVKTVEYSFSNIIIEKSKNSKALASWVKLK